ncbi:hypothetical protein CEG14_17285 [Bordetella genomosp. 1]|uniref:Uncharacterized protein n=1 Tax=Bordetella genomosp. 1 TaxID=1395607 RepID=A0A261S6Q1_9BORD|nr:hypothetical protein [Bordetella genomosp. 1]MDQ8034943.1 hypothetical protein [Bordetella sp.]OZI32662.1 hypothetical protein CEG14_17285 [Bordetella genomosp. 1]OZI65979.1 hypothetical protein CAL27_13415 [Bordetella genomosp. 1]
MTYVAVCSLLVILAIVALLVATIRFAGSETPARVSAALGGSTFAFLLILPVSILLMQSFE